MAELTERSVGYGFGLIGGALLVLGGLFALAAGTADLILGRPAGAFHAGSEALVLVVVGGLGLFFAYLGRHAWRERGLATGVLLVLVALVGWAVLDLGTDVVALLGAIFVFLGGVLFLLEPARRVAHDVVATA